MMVGLNSGNEAIGPLRAIDERVRRQSEANWTGGGSRAVKQIPRRSGPIVKERRRCRKIRVEEGGGGQTTELIG